MASGGPFSPTSLGFQAEPKGKGISMAQEIPTLLPRLERCWNAVHITEQSAPKYQPRPACSLSPCTTLQ